MQWQESIMHMEAVISGAPLQSGFITMSAGQNFLLACNAPSATDAIVVIPPFAEEMNKSRHLISAAMRMLSAAGYGCFMLDNYGTGDSAGDLGNASIDIWRADLYQLIQLLQQHGYQRISFIALRFGTLQLFDLLSQYTLPLPVKQLVLWQPVFDMAKFWQQFARIKVAEAMALGKKLSQKALEQQLDNGESIEIAGYPISPAFYHSLFAASPTFPAALHGTRLCWLETSQLDNIALPVEKMRQQLKQHCDLCFHQLKDEPYWQTAELASADSLLALTVQYLTGRRHDA
jgi:exosortase A-associated hydrolase 2